MKKIDRALLRAVMRGWDAKADTPSESIDNICNAVAAYVRREKGAAWDEGAHQQYGETNPYRGRARS